VEFEDSSNYVLNKDLFEVARVDSTLSCITSINSRNLLFTFIQLKYTNSSQWIDLYIKLVKWGILKLSLALSKKWQIVIEIL